MLRILSILLALLVSASAWADNLVVKNVAVPQGGAATLDVELKNPEHAYTAFQMALQLPTGVRIAFKNETEESVPVVNGSIRLNGHMLSAHLLDNGDLQVVCFSLDGKAFRTTSGKLFSLVLETDAGLPVGTELQGKFHEIAFTTADAEVTEIQFEEVPFTITVGEPTDAVIKFNENAILLPRYTTGDQASVQLSRTIKANQWSTIVLPFTLTKSDVDANFGVGVKLAEFTDFEVDYSRGQEEATSVDITLSFTTFTVSEHKKLQGGHPYLIKTTEDINTIAAASVPLVAGVTAVTMKDADDIAGSFTGTLVKCTLPVDGLFISNDSFWYSTGTTAVKAFRGWFQLQAVTDPTIDYSVKMVLIDGEDTHINELKPATSLESIFDLSGRKVLRSQKKGVYVIDGKKVIR